VVLQEGRYCPVGSVDERRADVKLVVATNEDLGVMVREGRFREDLYMRLNPATAMRLPSLRERRDDFAELLAAFLDRVVADPYNRELLVQYARQRGLTVPSTGRIPIAVGPRVPERIDAGRVHFLLQPSSLRQLREYAWPGNFRQLEMTLSNLVALTLVELVDRAAEVEPDEEGEGLPAEARRADVVPIPPRTVRELLRPMEASPRESAGPVSGLSDLPGGGHRVVVDLRAKDSLNAVGCDVERQYLAMLYDRYEGDLSRMAEMLLDDPAAGRKVQLRMNQLGLHLRKLKRRKGR
jgi:DNA-binding NtrC family response regulator